jgi:hypothetical protein
MINSEDKEIPLHVMEALCKWEGCDVILCLGLLEQSVMAGTLLEALPRIAPDTPAERLDEMTRRNDLLNDLIFDKTLDLMERYEKPIIGMGTLLNAESARLVYKKREDANLGCLFYPEPERAVAVVAKLAEYAKYRNA